MNLDYSDNIIEVKDLYKTVGDQEIKENIRKKYKSKLDEISKKFNKRKNNTEFLDYILKLRPYNGYEDDLKKGKTDLNKDSSENLKYLQSKYHPDKYTYKDNDEKTQLDYCIVEEIDAHLNKMSSLT